MVLRHECTGKGLQIYKKPSHFHHIITFFIIFSFILFITLFTSLSEALEINLEKSLHEALVKSGKLISDIDNKLKHGISVQVELTQLKKQSEEIKKTHTLLKEKFSAKSKEIDKRGLKASGRHGIMTEGYLKALEEYLVLIESLPDGNSRQQTTDRGQGSNLHQIINRLKTLLDKTVTKKKRNILGSLPYRNLNYPLKEPSGAPAIKPAYKGGNKTVVPDDLKSIPEAPISKEITALAQTLNWNPVLIYEYVKNNIETEWYFGSMKGAEETLRQKSGNACDHASLLIALLRASGYPSRYVRGTIEFFPDVDRAKNLTGINDILKLASFFQKAGIPYNLTTSGGRISNIQIEHIWVESQIPYANYRGAILDTHGKTWLGLDTSIKTEDYIYNTPLDIFQQSAISNQLSTLRDEYLSTVQTLTPLQYIEEKLSAITGQQPIEEYKLKKKLTSEIMNILPASLQFNQIKITNEYTELPDELKHKVKFTAVKQNTVDSSQDNLFNITIETQKLSNKKIILTYEPETVEDHEIINSYGGIDNTPSYLIRLRPVLKIDGERITVSKDGLPAGEDYLLKIELTSPSGIEKITSIQTTGAPSAIGIVAQRSIQQTEEEQDKNAEQILYQEAINHIERWNKAEEELASLFNLILTRPVPSVAITGGAADVTYLLDTPHKVELKGVYIDSALRTVETADSREGTVDRQKLFMQLSALQGSILENRIFEDDFKVESISTAKLLQIAGSSQNTADRVITIDRTNIDVLLPTLLLDDNIKEDIINAVNQNLTVRIPKPASPESSSISYLDWTGVGYIKEDIKTGEAGYMLSGMIAGGMTAVSPYKWTSGDIMYLLAKPYTGGSDRIFITSPKNGATVYTSPIRISGIITDPKAGVKVNGTEAVTSGKTFTAMDIRLDPGTNTVTAVAVNKAGIKTSDTIKLKYKIPLQIEIIFPFDESITSVSPIDINGIISDPSASLSVNGIKATVQSDGRFTSGKIWLVPGINRITTAAVNTDGESSTQTIVINYQPGQGQPPLFITVTSPSDGAAITKPSITVTGTVYTEAKEVWIKVNGIPADIYGNIFIANDIPLAEGSNIITVNALDSNGVMAKNEITVTASPSAPHIILRAGLTSGISPLTTTFSASTQIQSPVSTYQIDFEGDGTVDHTGTTFDNISHTYTQEGIFYPAITVTDNNGNTYTDRIGITVYNKIEIDTLLKGKWEGMKGAFANKDIEKGLNYFHKSSRERYRQAFNVIINELPLLISDMQNMEIIYLQGNLAKYRINRVHEVEGVLQTITYYIYFVKDSDGTWKIQQF